MTSDPAHDPRYVPASVTARFDVTEELWIVRVEPAQPVHFVPGQYITVALQDSGKLVERPYSVASAPGERDLEFFLELVREGQLTPHLYNVPVGSEVYLRRAAKGLFVFDLASGHRNHFMIATVTGAAPYVSTLRTFAKQGPPRPDLRIAMLHTGGAAEELGYAAELASLAGRVPWFRYIPSISRPWLDSDWTGEIGRAEDVARKQLDALGFRPDDTTVYLCGNPYMIANLKGILERALFPKSAVKEELFWVAE